MKFLLIVFVILLAFSLFLFGCKEKSSTPTELDQDHFEIEMTILSHDSLGTVGGPGFYYKLITRNLNFSPLWGDTVVKMLLDSNIAVSEFLYPAEPGICHDPFMGAQEIVKLEQPDTSIYRFGHTPLDSVFTFPCINHWRLYKIVPVKGSAQSTTLRK